MKEILIIGAKSDIAKAIVKEYIQTNRESDVKFILCARNSYELDVFCEDIINNYAISCEIKELDVCSFATHSDFIESYTNIYGVIYVAGIMPNQIQAQDNFYISRDCINTNLLGAISILELCAKKLENKQNGFIIAISSVAGDRGRANNYIYGCTKSGLSTFMSGLYNRFNLQKKNIKVLCVHCGFVATKMTANLKLPKILCAKPQEVAQDIINGLKKNKSKIYSKSIWKYIAFVIKHMPDFMFKNFKL